MRHLTPIARSLATLAILSSGAASWPAAAQHIEPERPSSTQQRGSIGQPFPGIVKDLEVIGPDRFVLTISDRPEGRGMDQVQVYTSSEGLVGRPFVPDQRTVFDVAPASDGGFWVLYYTADEVAEAHAPAAGMRLQRFDRSGEPVGESRLLTESLADGAAAQEARRGWIIPLRDNAVAVAFTSFTAATRLHALRFAAFDPHGREGSTETLEDSLSHMPNVSSHALLDGGAALAWGTGDPLGERMSLTTLDPDGGWIDSVQSIWSSSPRRGSAFNVRLTPVAGSDQFAAVFLTQSGHVWQRFGQNGVATSGVEGHGSISSFLAPIALDGRRLVYVAGGRGWPARLYTGGAGEPPVESGAGPDGEITALAAESPESVVVAAVVPPVADPNGQRQPFSYLFRFRP
ncbi:hypothetical protein [Brevundimonas viscosa]|uniref:WD40-like Beta Propeller Repeat n=1 Tax=Brevundimonas viscosa TaxID=871741 RepID=A0A1I6TCT9_9CAUL|nr:hypothetical protein [Brevundimonas viscosa]SFS87021.1 hypothetical protein SAMN05192570_3134 [Brevundimonas viscosa]